MNKRKIINDPIYGFLTIPFDIIFDLIEHPYFQRLRRINQLGLTSLVYPGALHTRFHHVLGALNLTYRVIENLRQKEIVITEEEAEGVCIAILLHDIGHGPFSHSLEKSIVKNIHHEDISLMFMNRLNEEFNGKLTLAIRIFRGEYHKKFLHQLVSSQLDMDRLDYLGRDSFYTGVSEGIVGSDRIIKMLYVVDDELVIEEKGIYSIEKFIVARRLMYWQVYLHKTTIAAESVMIQILRRAKELAGRGEELFATPSFKHFLYNSIDKAAFEADPVHLELFSKLDDSDVYSSIKVWAEGSDKVLKVLCNGLLNRSLPKIEIRKEPFGENRMISLKEKTCEAFGVTQDEAGYFVYSGSVENTAYVTEGLNINILQKSGRVIDIGQASDNYNIAALNQTVKKFYLCYPKICLI